MKETQKIPFRGCADESPGIETGDVVIVIIEKDHDVFQRKGFFKYYLIGNPSNRRKFKTKNNCLLDGIEKIHCLY